MLESWLVRRMLCRSGTKGYSHFLHSLLKELADADPSEAEGIIHRRLLAAEAEGTTWPTDAQVRSAVLTNPIYRQLRRDRLRFVLEGIEDFGRDDKVEQWCPTNLTVEHVMPQHWSSNWPIGDDPTGERTLERNNLIHTLGNLSLVTNRLNPSLSNSAWAEKRVALREHSVLLLSDQLLESDAWHEEAILERGRRMADVICEIWPRPTGPT
jgi:hypothetical protein